jgi:hypothetical protein
MTFLQQRERLITGKLFHGISSCYAEIQNLVKSGQWRNVVKIYQQNIHTLKLSPGAHSMLKLAHLKLGDLKMATQEERQVTYLIQQIIKTGEGNREKPYLITIMSDVHDIVGDELLNEWQEKHGNRLIDIVQLSGATVCFDISHLRRFIRFSPVKCPPKLPK